MLCSVVHQCGSIPNDCNVSAPPLTEEYPFRLNTGVRVRDVLKATGLDVDGMALGTNDVPGAKIVNFIAEDTDETGNPYAGVLPIGKVIDPFGDAILAYEMNGETLPRDHGYPLRLLAPGHAGCRNVKWVSTIDVSEAPSELDAGSKLDRHFAPNYTFLEQIRHGDEHYSADSVAKSGTKQSIRLDQGPVIQTLPVQSIICFPQNKATLSGERSTIEVKGFAWSGGGRVILLCPCLYSCIAVVALRV